MSVVAAINGHAIESFRTYLVDLITKRGLTVAETVKTVYPNSRSDGYKVMNGHRQITPAMAPRWAEVLGVAPEELLKAQPKLTSSPAPRKRSARKLPESAQPLALRARLEGFLAERGWQINDFRAALGLKSSGGIYAVLTGSHPLTIKNAAKWASVLGVTAESLVQLSRKTGSSRTPPPPVYRQPVTRNPSLAGPVAVPIKDGTATGSERFSLVIGANGKASLKLDLDDLPVEVALEVVAALKLPTLVSSPPQRLKLTHAALLDHTEEQKD